MAKSDKNKQPSARELLLTRARERYPDRKFADIGAEPSEGVADLDESINEYVGELVERQKGYDENNAKLASLLDTDPSAAEFIQKWIETGDPRTALIEVFGDDLGMSEEAQGKFKDNLNKWRERKSANDALEAQAGENWTKTLEELQAWGESKNLSMEQMRDVMVRLLSITFNGMESKYSVEDFDMAWAAMNHDTDVAAAREEGEVEGRNQKIAVERRKRHTAADAIPPMGGRQGGSMTPPTPPKKKSFWGEVNDD